MTAHVYAFPDRRSCYLCIHFVVLPYFDESPRKTSGVCLMYDKAVSDAVEVASHCPAYEPVREGCDGKDQ